MQNKKEISTHIADNRAALQSCFGDSFDIVLRDLMINRRPALGLYTDGMCDELKIANAVLAPLMNRDAFYTPEHTAAQIGLFAFHGADIKKVRTVEEAALQALSGAYVLFLEGETFAFSFGVQGYAKKSIEEPPSEQNEFGSQEGFTDHFKDNAALLRRKLKTPSLIIEHITLGKTDHTSVLLCHLKGKADEAALRAVKKQLKDAKLPTVLGSGWLRPFLHTGSTNLFSGSGVTERPDMLAAKLTEGRIGIIVDGTPFAVIVPYLFADYFHSLDDYLTTAAYALFIRLLRYLCFFIAVGLPGIFVAVCVFHPKILPTDVVYDIASAEAKTPFPLMIEAITIHLIYEVVREAGLRMPRAVGHAVSIVGALVIGDAAVNAGLIAAPMLIVVGITTIAAAVVSKLHDRIVVFRLILILAGGLTGFFGVFLGFAFLFLQMCALKSFGLPFLFPFSPFSAEAQKDAVFRAPWKILRNQKK